MEAPHYNLRGKLSRSWKLNMKFNLTKLRHHALDDPRSGQHEAYSYNIVNPRSDNPLHPKIIPTWIQSFTERLSVVSRAHKSKHKTSSEKALDIEVDGATHLGAVNGNKTSGLLNENDFGKAYETLFNFYVDDGRTLGFSCMDDVKYEEFVSGAEGFTMYVRITIGQDPVVLSFSWYFKTKKCTIPFLILLIS